MNRRSLLKAGWVILSLIACGGAYWAWDHRDYWMLNNFRVVEPGRVYAGGYQYPRPLERMIREHNIKTVVSLRSDDQQSDDEEQRVLAEHGVDYHRVIIPFKVSEADRIARIEQAVQILADPEKQPVYVHCWAGYHRTGAVVAIYRLSRCGWTKEAALEELVRWGGQAQNAQWPTRCVHAYCDQRVEQVASGMPDEVR